MQIKTGYALVLALGVLALSACKGSSSEQTFEQAMTIFCSSPTASGSMNEATPDQRIQVLTRYVESKITQPDVVAMWKGLGSMKAAVKVETVGAAAKKAGIADCEILKIWEPYVGK